MIKRIIVVVVMLLAIGGIGLFAAGTKEATGSSSEVVSLKYLAGTDKFDPETDFTRKAILERLGVNIIPEMGNEDDKVNLIVSSGQEYDAIRVDNRNLLSNFIENEAVQDLTELIEEYGPFLKQYLNQELWDMVSSDGKIYAIPAGAEGAIEWGTMVRTDWLEILGMDYPETPVEFREMLIAFREQDPGNVGSENVIPLTIPGAQMTDLQFNGIAQGFGIGRSPSSFIEKDGKLINGLELPGSREFLKFLNELYADQLLDIDFPANNGQALDQKVGSGVVGAAYSSVWWTSGSSTLFAENPKAGMEFMPPLKDSSGNSGFERLSGLKWALIVPRSSKKAAEVVKYANAFIDPANFEQLVVGTEGVHHEKRDGGYYPLFPAFNDLNKGRWYYPTQSAEIYLPLFACRAHKEERMGYQFDKLQEFQEFAYDDIYKYTPNLPEIQQYSQSLNAFVEENLTRMVIDEEALASYDKFVAEWKRRGGGELTAALNRWYTSR